MPYFRLSVVALLLALLLSACGKKADNAASDNKAADKSADKPAATLLDDAYAAQFPELKLPHELTPKAVLANLLDRPTVPTLAWRKAVGSPLEGDEAQYPHTTVIVGRYKGPEGTNRYVTLTFIPNTDAPIEFQVYAYDAQAQKYVVYTDNLKYVEMMVRSIDNTVTLQADGSMSIQSVERKFDMAKMQADPNHPGDVVRDETQQLAFQNGQWTKGK